MKKEIDRITDKITLLAVIYTIGSLLGGLLYLLKALKRIRILHWERFPRKQGNLIIVSNHPSLVEPILLPVLFFRDYFFHPIKLSPWSIPDKTNYYDRWYWFWVRPRAIPVDRKNKRAELKAFFKMKNVLASGERIVFFPEGGRTFKGKDFFYSPEKHKRLRMLKEGAGLLVAKTGATVFPIWVEGTDKVLPNSPDKLYHCFPRIWKKMTIKIGEPLSFEGNKQKEEITQKIITTLLKLADEPCPL